MSNSIAPWPHFSEDEILAVREVLESGKVNYWTGQSCKNFEKEFADYVGCKYGIALANGSVALELALIGHNIGEGDEVIVTCRSFMASASCATLRGAIPVFADVDQVSQNISIKSIKEKLTAKTKAIICVHLAGWPCDMDEINAVAAEHGLVVIEDCAQAHGARYKGKNVGSLGDISVFSFCQDKIMTTGGEGGILLTDDYEVFKRCWAYKEHGKSYDLILDKKQNTGFNWCIESFGTNWRMTEMQAAIGLAQLKKLDGWVEKRRENARALNEAFGGLPLIRTTVAPEHVYHSYYKYYVFIRPEFLKEGWDRDRIIVEIEAKGMYCGSGSCGELYREKAFEALWAHNGNEVLPVAHELANTSLMFMVHPTLTSENMASVIEISLDTLKRAQK